MTKTMKSTCIALVLFCGLAAAQAQVQSPPPVRVRTIHQQQSQNPPLDPNTALPDNYQLTLVVSDGEKPATELSVVAVTPQFKVDGAEPNITFAGTITPEEAGTVLVAYVVSGDVPIRPPEGAPSSTIQYRMVGAQAAARLRLGETLQILKSGTRTFKLTISKLDTARK